MYPNDDLCQYLYYTDVVIVDGKIRPSSERNSWKLFQIKARSYTKVQSGIAFDHWQITPELVRNAKNELDELARNKIGSYGLLNVIRKPSELKDVVQAMKPVIEVLKELQGSDDDRRTVIAIGSYDYGGLGFLNTYRDIFKDIIDTFKADAAIAISSVSSMEDQAGCYAAPPNVFKSSRSKFPSLVVIVVIGINDQGLHSLDVGILDFCYRDKFCGGFFLIALTCPTMGSLATGSVSPNFVAESSLPSLSSSHVATASAWPTHGSNTGASLSAAGSPPVAPSCGSTHSR
ncbi:hypothetical protein MRX96_001492 [Rhipicephalus microplus]